MKISRMLVLMMVLSLVAACGGSGGGGGGPTPTPTTPEARAASGAAVEKSQEASGQAILGALEQFIPAIVLKAASSKAASDKPIDITQECNGGGSFTATGTITAECTGLPASTTCVISNSSVNIAFADCYKGMDVEGVNYGITLNGPASASLTGSITADISAEEPVILSSNFTGALSGEVTIGGDVVGTVDLDGVMYSGSGGDQPTIACSGTCTVTVDGEAEATCGVSSDCGGCTE